MTTKENYPYQTIEDHYRENGNRHLERAISYISAGYPDRFADGSLRKARNNFEKADSLKVPYFMDRWISKLCKHIALTIMNGISK